MKTAFLICIPETYKKPIGFCHILIFFFIQVEVEGFFLSILYVYSCNQIHLIKHQLNGLIINIEEHLTKSMIET